MRQARLKMLLLLILSCFVLGIAPSHALAAEDTEQEANAGYLVVLPEDLTFTAVNRGSSAGLTYVAPGIYMTEDAELAARMLESGMAESVEPNYPLTLFSTNLNWSYQAVGGEYAEILGLDGSGVRISVIDSGILANNENLAGARIVEGYDYIRNTTAMTDDAGHGTYVSQVIAGAGKNGVQGLARRAEIVPLRCFSKSEGDTLTAIRAITDAVNVYHCDVINMSWGGSEDSNALHRAIRDAYAAGAVLVAAAGNVSSDMPQGTVLYPAAYDEVIGVGAVDKNGEIADFSMQTRAVNVSAPGAGVYVKSYNGTQIMQISGTSFASPYVAAEAALLRELSPAMSNREIMELLTDRAEDRGTPGYDTQYGHGYVAMEGLLSEPWYHVVTAQGRDAVEGWYCRPEVTIVAAGYDETGKMRGSSVAERYVFGFSGREIARFKLFLLGENWIPIEKCLVYPIE